MPTPKNPVLQSGDVGQDPRTPLDSPTQNTVQTNKNNNSNLRKKDKDAKKKEEFGLWMTGDHGGKDQHGMSEKQAAFAAEVAHAWRQSTESWSDFTQHTTFHGVKYIFDRQQKYKWRRYGKEKKDQKTK